MKCERAAIALSLCVILLAASNPGEAAVPETATPFQHVIVIMQENHSFDNYFGTYPTANGTLLNSVTSQLPKVNGIPDSVCEPYQGSCLRPELTTSAPVNPVEGQLIYEHDYQGNASGFAENSGPQSMLYFDYHSVAAYWDYAEEYGLGDNYFAAVLSQTTPNRLMLLSGDSPVPSNDGPPPYAPYASSLMNQLDSAGVSWGYYDYLNSSTTRSQVYPVNYFSGIPQSALPSIRNVSSLYSELSSGSGLPDVSFVNSLYNKSYDEHPSANPSEGENWVVSVVDRVMQSAFWNTTAVIITWDEGGGFYDHVVPPSRLTIDHGFQNPLLGLGARVPFLVISPYSLEAHVSHTLLSHLSIVHFIEYNWNLSPLNMDVAGSNLPLDFFDFSQAPRAPIILGPGASYSADTYPLPPQVPLTVNSSGCSCASSSQSASSTSQTHSGSVTSVSGSGVVGPLVAVAVTLALLLTGLRLGRKTRPQNIAIGKNHRSKNG